jgi:hypothetical protein
MVPPAGVFAAVTIRSSPGNPRVTDDRRRFTREDTRKLLQSIQGGPVNHTTSTPDSDGDRETPKISPLANPRRIRLGADGRPTFGPVTTTSD